MSEAKRYIFDSLLGMMVENADGEYRRNSDYEARERENSDLTARIASLEREKEEARDKALEEACGVLQGEANRMTAKYGATTKAGTIGEVAMLLGALSLTIRVMKGAKP